MGFNYYCVTIERALLMTHVESDPAQIRTNRISCRTLCNSRFLCLENHVTHIANRSCVQVVALDLPLFL